MCEESVFWMSYQESIHTISCFLFTVTLSSDYHSVMNTGYATRPRR